MDTSLLLVIWQFMAKHPIISGLLMLIISGIVIALIACCFLCAWNTLFPVSYYLWILSRKSRIFDLDRSAAARALGEIGNQRAVEPLIGTLAYGDRSLRLSVTEALGKLRDRRAVGSLIKVLRDEDDNVRRGAAESLGKIGDLEAVDPLLNALKAEHVAVRSEVTRALVRIGDGRAVGPLVRALSHLHAGDRLIVSKWLREVGWEPTNQREAIMYYIANQQWEKLVEIGDPAIGPLIEKLGEWGIGGPVVETLVKIGRPSAGPLIRTVEEYRNVDAVKALGKISDPRAVEPLVQALKDEKSYVRKNAAWALGEIGDQNAIDSLVEALEDEDWQVRGSAAEALGKIGNSRTVEPLIKLLRDKKERSVRMSAAVALGMIGDTKAIDPLFDMLCTAETDANEQSSEAEIATQVLGKIGDIKALEPLRNLLSRTSETVWVNYAESGGTAHTYEESNGTYWAIKAAISAIENRLQEV